ncbi:Solute carrier 26 [Entophlyctis luteolus]|nr:Solute carrier 26 [Entophlyctis luteolus]
MADASRAAFLARALATAAPRVAMLRDSLRVRALSVTSLGACFPLLRVGRRWSLATLRDDLLGALTVTMIMLPQAIAYASLVHIPISNTLMSAVVPVIAYAIFGGSTHLSMGPEATISTIVGAAVQLQVASNPNLSAVQVAASLSLITGLLLIILSIIRAGFIDHILSGYLQTGFITGAACLIIVEQLASILGLTMNANQSESTILQFIEICKALPTAKYATILLSFSNIAFLLLVKSLKKHFSNRFPLLKYVPEYLLLAIIMIVISACGNLEYVYFSAGIKIFINRFFRASGIIILGQFDNPIPTPSVPVLTVDLISNLFEPALTVLLVGYIECMTVTRNFGLRNGFVPSGNSELFAIGFTNLVSSFFGCYPVFASLPRSRILVNCGSRTTLSNALAGVFILIAFVGLKGLFQYIPKAMLSSIIVVSALGLIETKKILFIFQTRALPEIFMLLATFAITLATSLSTGILLCLGLSALLIVRKTTVSSISIMGRLPGQQTVQSSLPTTTDSIEIAMPAQRKYYVSITDHPEAQLLDGVLIVRVDTALMFYNCAQLRRGFEAVMAAEKHVLVARRRKQLQQPQERSEHAPALSEGKESGWLVAGSALSQEDGLPSELDVADGTGDEIPPIHGEPEEEPILQNKSWDRIFHWRRGLEAVNTDEATKVRARSGARFIHGISMFDSSGDVPVHPSALHHAAIPVSSQHSKLSGKAESKAIIMERRCHRRSEPASIHTMVVDFKHCLDMDTAAALVVKELLHTFVFDGIVVILSGLHVDHMKLLKQAGMQMLLDEYCLCFDSLEEAVEAAEKAT